MIYTAADRGPTAYTCFYTTAGAVARRREDFRAMAAACKRAVAAVYAEGSAGALPTLTRFFPNEPPALLSAAVDRYIAHKLYNPTGALPEQGFERLKRSMITVGFIRKGAAFSDCVDNSLV